MPATPNTKILNFSIAEIKLFISNFKNIYPTNIHEIEDLFTHDVCEFISNFDTPTSPKSFLFTSSTYIKLFKKYYNTGTSSFYSGGNMMAKFPRKTMKTGVMVKKNKNTKTNIYIVNTRKQITNQITKQLTKQITKEITKKYLNFDFCSDLINQFTYENAFNRVMCDILKCFNIISTYNDINRLKKILFYNIELPYNLKRSVSLDELEVEITEFNNFLYDKYNEQPQEKQQEHNFLSKFILRSDKIETFEYDYIKFANDINGDHKSIYDETDTFFKRINENYYLKQMSLFEFRYYKQIFQDFISYYYDIAQELVPGKQIQIAKFLKYSLVDKIPTFELCKNYIQKPTIILTNFNEKYEHIDFKEIFPTRSKIEKNEYFILSNSNMNAAEAAGPKSGF
jgi:hypothetical protein